MSDTTRRHFLSLVTCAGAAVCCGGAEAFAQTEAPAAPEPKPTSLDAGPVKAFDKDAVTDTFAKSHRVFIIRNEGQLYAASATCTHKRQSLRLKDGGIYCPSHGSTFSEHGTSTKGPAKISLPRYAVSVNAEGHLIVDLTKTFVEKEWEDAAAFVAVK